jgi:excisionase family DNA binding protein
VAKKEQSEEQILRAAPGRGRREGHRQLTRAREQRGDMTRESAAKMPQYTGPINVMTVREVAAYLRVHPGTIYKLLKRHQIPAFRIGSDWRFRIEAIDRWRLEQGHGGFEEKITTN